MIVGFGFDIEEVDRIEDLILHYEGRFIDRYYRQQERDYCERGPEDKVVEKYAAFWAVKEATSKALGTGQREGVRLRDIEIMHNKIGKPYVKLHGQAASWASWLGANNIQVTMSHLDEIVGAAVIMEKLSSSGAAGSRGGSEDYSPISLDFPNPSEEY